MKTPNWKEHTEKLLDWYEVLIEQGNPKGDHAKEVRAQIIAVGELLDDTEKNLYNAAQELEFGPCRLKVLHQAPPRTRRGRRSSARPPV